MQALQQAKLSDERQRHHLQRPTARQASDAKNVEAAPAAGCLRGVRGKTLARSACVKARGEVVERAGRQVAKKGSMSKGAPLPALLPAPARFARWCWWGCRADGPCCPQRLQARSQLQCRPPHKHVGRPNAAEPPDLALRWKPWRKHHGALRGHRGSTEVKAAPQSGAGSAANWGDRIALLCCTCSVMQARVATASVESPASTQQCLAASTARACRLMPVSAEMEPASQL